jgi:DNA-binding response OmpR family regulator
MSVEAVNDRKRDFRMKIMVVEDERDIRDILKGILEEEGFQVVTLDNSQSLIEEIRRHEPDLLLLDHILPGRTGVDALREVRAHEKYSRLPVIMVTGLSSEDDKVAALDIGADDYVTKPFYPKELSARIKALARRSITDVKRDKIVLGGLVMDFSSHRVTISNNEVALTLTEFKILAELLKQVGQVLTREKLRERALGNLNVTDRTIDVHMASLRKKLGTLGDAIETVRGVGYRFAD